MISPSLVTNGNAGLEFPSISADLARAGRDLSTGLRVNAPVDDPAAYVHAARLQTTVSGLDAASSQIQKATSATTIAEAALSSLTEITQRIRGLASGAETSLASPAQLQAVQDEITQLLHEFNAIAQNTKFNGIPLLSGTSTPATPHIVNLASNVYDTGSNVGLTTSITASFGVAPTIGDVLIAGVAHGDGYGSGGGAATLTVPTGWKTVTNFDNGNNTGFTVYTHVVSGIESGTYTWSFTNTKPGNTSAVVVAEVAGADNSSPIATYSELFDSNITPASPILTDTLTAPTAGELPFAYFAPNEDMHGTPTIAGWTVQAYPYQRYSDLNFQTAALTTAGQTLQAGFQPNVTTGDNGESTILFVTPGAPAIPRAISTPTNDAGDGRLSTTPLPLNSKILALTNIDVTQSASAAVQTADSALDVLAQQTLQLGGFALALQSEQQNAAATSQTLTNARAQAVDADIPTATTDFARGKLLTAFNLTLLRQHNLDQQSLLGLFTT